MVTERSTGRGRSHASAMSLQQACSKRLLHPFHACACRGKRNGCARGAGGNTPLLDHGSEQAQVSQIEMHGTPPSDGHSAYVTGEGTVTEWLIVVAVIGSHLC